MRTSYSNDVQFLTRTGGNTLVVKKISETARTIKLGWTPVVCLGYVLYVDGVRKSNSWDSAKSTWDVAKGGTKYEVVALGAKAQGSYKP